MDTTAVTIRRMEPASPDIPTCAGWRYEAFFKGGDFSYDDAVEQLADLVDRQGYEVALLAEVAGVPAGTCLFVRHEMPPAHELTPWLAGLYVAPEFRRRGVGRQLVTAIEAHGRQVGCRRLYLYTLDAEGFYARLGWKIAERFERKGEALVLMTRDL